MSIRIRENDLQVILDLLQHADHFLQCVFLVFQKLRLTLRPFLYLQHAIEILDLRRLLLRRQTVRVQRAVHRG